MNRVIPKIYRNNKKTVIFILKKYTEIPIEIIDQISPELLNDFDVIWLIFRKNPETIIKVMNNYELVKRIVSINFETFKYLSNDLKNDDEIVKIAVKECPLCILDANSRYLKDKDFLKNVMKYYLSKKHYDDAKTKTNFQIMTSYFKDDVEFMNDLLFINSSSYNYMTDDIKNNPEIVYTYLDLNPQKASEFPLFATKSAKILLNILSKNNCPTFNQDFIRQIDKEILKNKEIGYLLVKNNKIAYNYLDVSLQNNIDIKTAVGIIEKNEQNLLNENYLEQTNKSFLEETKKYLEYVKDEIEKQNRLIARYIELENENKSLREELIRIRGQK